ncbi:flagellar hook-basal body complex protein FliE [Paracoccus albus]|uniref:flagellar hook-basal body complex protein FliE n=1 Tax=Paracoccus albus TaxID=3017784 RepID=UPI0022F0E4EC|nr:flagellar hook-basal body complex protein FliE [Paracoccus albus]WBU59796.1 flagellar hook-basal body complex protein FliE [Paracoccus albus]
MISSSNIVAAYLRGTGAAEPAAPVDKGAAAALGDFEAVMAKADQSAIGAMSGTSDTRQLVLSLTEAELALDAAVAIRDKVVEAYQEILRMPV